METDLNFHAILITGGAKRPRQETALKLARKTAGVGEKGVLEPNVTILGLEEGSLGIELVRELKEKLSLKGVAAGHRVAVILEAQNLTPEAQNALLKTLEDPGPKTTLILTATHRHELLPTIVSRCYNHELKITSDEGQDEGSQNVITPLKTLLSLSPKARLEFTETNANIFTNRNSLVDLIDRWLTETRIDLLSPHTAKKKILAKTTAALIEVREQINHTNANPRLILENFLLDQD